MRPAVVDGSAYADAATVVALVNSGLAGGDDVLLLGGGIRPAAADVARALGELDADPRVATVSLAGSDGAHEGVPFARGPAVLVAARAAELVGALETDPTGADVASSIADFSLRARARGLFDLEGGSSPAATSTASQAPRSFAVDTLLASRWLAQRHPQVVAGLGAEEPTTVAERRPLPVSVLPGDALRVLIDDTTLGPYETGAQITTLALVRALAARDDVAEVGVALKHGVPPYASSVLSLPKVCPMIRNGSDYAGFDHYDVLHRTTQPDPEFSVDAARACASRVVVTLLDLIGYRSGAYFATAEDWLAYRRGIRAAVAAADAVTTISRDVARAVEREALPIASDRLVPVLYGTDHLTGEEPAEIPPGIVAAGRVADDFVLCLGTDYLHKNRDVALGVHRELEARGRRVTLVLAGATVPCGGTAAAEARMLAQAPETSDVAVLPSVRPAERNWLLEHATTVLYPTAAEGFGLVPFEAARFGTPAVHARFGPFVETLGDLPVEVDGWAVEAFADAVEALLADPGLRRAQVEAVLGAATRLRWADTVEQYVAMYRALLEGRPVMTMPEDP